LKIFGKEEFPVSEYPLDEKTSFDGKKVKVLGATFEEGKPEGSINWRQKLRSREEMLAYLKTGERYWFSDEWYGSEKRKTKA
jgi:hypothetical protein